MKTHKMITEETKFH